MEGEGGSCRLNGLYMVTGTQHVDNQVIIDHMAPHTTSRELYKGILDGKSRSVFHGSIIVRPGAMKVDALQEDKNLLLSDQAEADTKPAFWVYCDDVRCGHGAACGQIDEDALFYLRNRGLSEQSARRFLTRGFVWDIIQSIRNGFIQAHVDDLTQATLRDWLGDESD
jgi:Fe-S cluster assembly protein SufD